MTLQQQQQQNSQGKTYFYLIYTLVILYAVCYQLQSPIEPFLVDRLLHTNSTSDASSTSAQQTYGNLQTVFNICQMIGSLIFGTILDKFGIRIGFVCNFVSCACSYYLLSQATSIYYLYASKIPAMFMAGFLVAQSACLKALPQSNSSSQQQQQQQPQSMQQQRMEVLGKLTASYTVGATVGPTIGGILGASGDYYLGAKLACFGSLLCAALAWFGLPSNLDDESPSTTSTSSAQPADDSKQTSIKNTKWSFLGRYSQAIQISGVFLSIKAITSVANSMSSTVRPLILKNQLGLSEKGLGLFMSITFGVGGIVNAFGLGTLSTWLGRRHLFGQRKRYGTVRHVNGNGEVQEKSLSHDSQGGSSSSTTRFVVQNSILGMCLIYAILSLTYSTTGIHILHTLDHQITNNVFQWKPLPYIFFTLLLSILQFVLSTAITAETTSMVPTEIRGTMISLEHSIFSAPRIIAPTLGVAIYGKGDIMGVCLVCSLIFGGVWVVWSRWIMTPKKP